MTRLAGNRSSKVRCLAICWALLATPELRGELKLLEVRATHGRLGSTRATTTVLPGEDLHATYQVSGISKGPDAKAEITRTSELLDDEGEVIAQVPAKSSRIYLALGGDSFASHMHFGLPLDFPPGKYLVRGTLVDVRSGERLVAEQAFEVVPLDFGLVRLRLAADAEGTIPIGGNLTVNQDVYLVARAIGFARKGSRINVVGNMTIYDMQGKPTMPAPISFEVDQEVDDDLGQLDVNWSLVGNRVGKFVVHIEVRDEVAGKRAVYEMPLVVAPAPGVEKPRSAKTGARKPGA